MKERERESSSVCECDKLIWGDDSCECPVPESSILFLNESQYPQNASCFDLSI